MGSPLRLFLVLFSLVSLKAGLCFGSEIHFEKAKILLAGKSISIEIAKTPSEHAHGLMFRKKLGSDEGMLFVFENEEIRHFWMKNTLIDLSIGYFDKDKVLVDIQEMTATSLLDVKPPSYPSAKPAMYALEMNKGWFRRNGLKIGQKFQLLKR